MEIKRNEATLNRPEGDRVIDAPLVIVDIRTSVDQLQREDSFAKNGRNGITVFKSGAITQVITAMEAGEEINDNEVDGYVSIQLLKGEGLFSTPDGEIKLMEHQLVNLHPHVVHSLKAVSDLVVLITTHSNTPV